jgi:hypothetical protein
VPQSVTQGVFLAGGGGILAQELAPRGRGNPEPCNSSSNSIGHCWRPAAKPAKSLENKGVWGLRRGVGGTILSLSLSDNAPRGGGIRRAWPLMWVCQIEIIPTLIPFACDLMCGQRAADNKVAEPWVRKSK